MKFLLKKLLIVLLFIGINESKANTLFDTLNSAYLNNPKLNAERASMRAAKEEKRETISEFLPSVTISGYSSEQDNTNPGADTSFSPSEQSMTIEQIKSQLLRIVPVHIVRDLTLEGPFIKSELALIKLVADGANRVEALRIAETFRAKTLDVTLGSFVFELTGRPNKIDAFIGLMKSLGDIEISRTGVSAISRGNKTETKILEQIKLN